MLPSQDALREYDRWVSEQKRFQALTRAAILVLDRDTEKITNSPLAMWNNEDFNHYFEESDLPRHLLASKAYLFVGVSTAHRPSSPARMRTLVDR